jgi:SAM-dependent methyltransferase
MSTESWSEFHKIQGAKNYPKYPNEAMLKVFYGDYLKTKFEIKEKMKVLDIGCGFGQNLLPFLDKGCECYGVEVSEDICKITQKIMKSKNNKGTIVHGDNRNIPFEDGFFDVIVSVNALHYEPTEAKINQALSEFSRVLKKDGMLYLSTVGPEHTIYRKAKSLGHHQYQIQNYDFRDGENYFYFDNLKYLDFYMSQFFEDVELGRVTEDLMQQPLDFLIAACRKKVVSS